MDFFEKLLPYLLSGISVGGQYALIAVGYTMVYGILRLIKDVYKRQLRTRITSTRPTRICSCA